jgi:DNA-directed RNA polymerase specialized sigma24 family protein
MARRLNKTQQKLAEESMRFVAPGIAAFIRRNPDLRQASRRCDLESVAMQAVCLAALTYDKTKSRPTTYFGTAIRHALYREVLSQQKQDGRYISVEKLLYSEDERSPAEARALRALKQLSAEDQVLLEDRLIEQISFEKLGREHGCDPRTIAKRVRRAIDSLRLAECDLT